MKRSLFNTLLATLLPLSLPAAEVHTDIELSSALSSATPGTTINLHPGQYTGGRFLEQLKGTAGNPIIIQGTDSPESVVFQGGNEALHLVDCNHVTLKNFTVTGFPSNGLNADDGSSFDTPAHHLTFENLRVLNTGPTGNHDGLKLSGVEDFTVRGCEFVGWGGSAIDLVGCHRGIITKCRFIGQSGYSQSNAVQIKGGSSDIDVNQSFFENVGSRSINLGGSTGLDYFRPSDATYEAKDIIIAGNRFVGSTAPVAWVTADNGHVHHNTIYLPEKWVGRILQETTDPRFILCQNGLFEDNLVIFNSNVSTFVNVGPNTLPETFVFRHNGWFELGGSRTPSLPTDETDGVYQIDPELINPGTETMSIGSDDPQLIGIGADYYRESSSQPTTANGIQLTGSN